MMGLRPPDIRFPRAETSVDGHGFSRAGPSNKSKKHYVGLTWADGDKKGGLAIQCDKNEYRGILAVLEGVTGKKAVNSDAMTVKN